VPARFEDYHPPLDLSQPIVFGLQHQSGLRPSATWKARKALYNAS